MWRIVKMLILGWIGKKIYDRVAASDEAEKEAVEAKPARRAPAKAAAKRTSRRTSSAKAA